MTYQPEVVCDCTGKPPWPEMQRLSVGGLNRYYLCPQCENVREEVCGPNGLTAKIRYHPIQSEVLSKAVQEQAQEMLALLGYKQIDLFGDMEATATPGK